MGLPARARTERVHVAMSENEIAAIDDVRFSVRLDSRSEAIRHLVRIGLEAANLSKDGEAT